MMLQSMKVIWRYRSFILGSIKKDFQLKYKNSLLGASWTIIQPLAMIIVYTVIFSQVMRAKLPGVDSTFAYSIHLCAGLLTWGLFAEIANRLQNIFIENANLIKKIRFPKICLPLIVIGNATINFCIIFSIFTLFLIFLGEFPGLIYLSLIPCLVLLALFALGLGITLGVLNVFFRDIGQFFGIFLNFWFWLTPIVYPVEILPKRVADWIDLNPLAILVKAFQDILVRGHNPDWNSLSIVLFCSIFLCILGFNLFKKHSGEMVDEL